MNKQLNELRDSCLESISLNSTLAPGIHVKQIGYEICKRWLEGGIYPLDEIPTGHIMESGRNSGPEFEKGILMALDEIAELKPLSVWIDPEFLEYLDENQPADLPILYCNQFIPELRLKELSDEVRILGEQIDPLLDEVEKKLKAGAFDEWLTKWMEG